MKKKWLKIFATIIIVGVLSSCDSSGKNEATDKNNASDTNAKSEKADLMKEVTIGTQIWSVNNLNVSKFRNGENIPESKNESEWESAAIKKQPSFCYLNNYSENGSRLGKLYNWYAVIDPRGLAPAGWHIPSDDEWTILTEYLGEEAGTKMKSKEGWSRTRLEENNISGFSGLPGGGCDDFGKFNYSNQQGFWWSSTEKDATHAWVRALNYFNGIASKDDGAKGLGLSVRCLRD